MPTEAGWSAFREAAGLSASPGFTVANAIGSAAGVGLGAYGVISGLQRGGPGGYTSAAGGALGVASGAATLAAGSGLLGSGATAALAAAGPYGMIAAAVLSIIGALLPGQKPSGKGQETAINLDSGDTWYRGLGGNRYSQANRDQSAQAVEQIGSLARQLGDALGGIRLGIDAAVGVTSSRGDGPGQLYLRVGEQRNQFSNDEEGAKALADEAATFLLNEFRKRAQGDYAGILNASPDASTLQQNLDWYTQVYQSFGKSAEAASAYQQALDQVTASYADNIAKAQELSLSTDAITAARDRELAKVTQQRDRQLAAYDAGLDIRIARATGGDQTSVNLAAFDLAATQEIDQARAQLESWGLTAEQVSQRILRNEQALAAERLSLQQEQQAQLQQQQDQLRAQAVQSAGSAISSLADYARSLAYSDKSALAVQDQYSLAQRQFRAVSGAALAGDANSLSRLKDYSESLLSASRAVNGSGAAYAADYGRVLDVLGSVGSISTDALTASYFAQITMQAQAASATTIVAAIQALQAEVASLRTQVAQGGSIPARAA